MRRVTTNTLRAWIGLRQRSMRAAILAPWRDARGVAAVEFAFVMPVLVLILTGVIQLGLLLFLHGNMGDVARDTARRLAVGELTAANAPSYAEGQLVNWGGTFTVTPTMPNPADPNDRDIGVLAIRYPGLADHSWRSLRLDRARSLFGPCLALRHSCWPFSYSCREH